MTSIKITVGTPSSEHGQTTVNIYANGAVNAMGLNNKESYKCETRLEEQQVSLLASTVLATSSQRIAGRKGIPDEVKYIFEITSNDKTTKIEIWDNDLVKYPALKKIIVALKRDIYSKSNQTILL